MKTMTTSGAICGCKQLTMYCWMKVAPAYKVNYQKLREAKQRQHVAWFSAGFFTLCELATWHGIRHAHQQQVTGQRRDEIHYRLCMKNSLSVFVDRSSSTLAVLHEMILDGCLH